MKPSVLMAVFSIGFGVMTEPALAQERFDWDGTLEPGQTLEIRNIVGDIVATGGSGSRASVEAIKSGDDDDFDRVRIEVIERGNRVIICAVYLRDPASRVDECRADDDDRRSRGHRDGPDVSVDFDVVVPNGVDFEVKTVTGDIDAHGLTGEVEATSVSGDIEVGTTGFAEATTVSGHIRVAIGDTRWNGELEFTTVSGDIILEFDGDLATEVEFTTVSGDIESDLPLQLQGRRISRRSLRGVIGDGDPDRGLELTTVSGDVIIRSRGA